jgi:hypothetical protein
MKGLHWILGMPAMVALTGCGGAVGTTESEPSSIARHDALTVGTVTSTKQTERTRSGSNGISYHGGPVMLGTPGIYFIWYGNWSGDTATTILPQLITALSGSGYEHINTTYYNGSNTHVAGTMALKGQATDNYSLGSSLTDSDVATIVDNHIGSGLPEDKNGVYFVLTSADVNETSGFCTQYCGWHANYARPADGADIKFAFVGNPTRCPSACEAQTTGPNGTGGADGMASIIAHESEEAISDPDGNAWFDSRGNENADKCAWTFGATSTLASNGSQYNFIGGGYNWLIQRNWVNANGGFCAMSF